MKLNRIFSINIALLAEREREREQEHQQHMAGEAQRAKQWEQVCFSMSISFSRF